MVCLKADKGVECYNPPYIFPGSPEPCLTMIVLRDQPPFIFPSAMPPDLMSKQPLPMNPLFLEDLPSSQDTPHPMLTQPLPEPLILQFKAEIPNT